MKEIYDAAKQLRMYAKMYETEAFLFVDPSLFMHLVSGKENQETMAFIASSLSYGNRKHFFPKIRFILDASARDVYHWVKNGDYEADIPAVDVCYYRLYTYRAMNKFLHALQEMLVRYGSIGEFLRANATDGPSALRALTDFFGKRDAGGVVPKDTTSACKRLCLFLRWMVRDNSPVDLGLWADFIDRRTLIMPLDTHVIGHALRLGLLTSATASMPAAVRLTEEMRNIFPDDPLKGDFALFGYGINHR